MTLLEKMIKDAKLAGLGVIIPEKPTSYFWVTDGQRIGYCEANLTKGPLFATVHKPCIHAGTGYKAHDMSEALNHSPYWARTDRPVVKYRDAAEFIAKHWQPLKQY
jgi:hypothetical protein